MPIDRWLPLLALAALTASRAPVHAASDHTAPGGFIVDAWTSEDGLPQNSVIACTQTRDGYLWVGTLNGLARFDGRRFTVFDEANTPGLPSGSVVFLFEDQSTNLWVGYDSEGVALIRQGHVARLEIGRASRESRLIGAAEDEEGALWLGTADGQLCRHENGTINVWRARTELPQAFRSLIREGDGSVWLGTANGQMTVAARDAGGTMELLPGSLLPAGQLDRLVAATDGGYWRLAEGRIQKWKGNEVVFDLGPYPWGTAFIHSAVVSPDGGLVVGLDNAGIYWFGNSNVTRRITVEDGLTHLTVLSLCFDREGDLWAGTDGGGLFRIRHRLFQPVQPLRSYVVQSLAEDARDGLWAGYNGGGVSWWRKDEVIDYSAAQGLFDPNVRSVFSDAQGRVWVGTWGGLFLREDDRFQQVAAPGLVRVRVQAIAQDVFGALWFGTDQGLARLAPDDLRIFTTEDGLSANAIRALASDAEGTVYAATANGGLNVVTTNGITVHRKRPDGLPSDHLTSLCLDREGVLWIGTAGSGLVRFKEGSWTTCTERDGLANNRIGYLLEDDTGHLWMGSSRGLMRVAIRDLNEFATGTRTFVPCHRYGQDDGLPASECTSGSQPAACQTREGMLYFPTIRGVAAVHPHRIPSNPHPPPVAIESVWIDQREQQTNLLHAPWPEQVTLVPGNQVLEVAYTSLNLAAPQRARFRFRLEGFDTGWIEAGTDRVARYPRLPPGDYTFIVTAANEDGVWNETGARMAVVVLPPFWRTAWFLTLAGALLLGAVAGTVYLISTQRLKAQVARLRQQEALERERARISRDLHDQLGANLTQVALLGELAEADKALPDEVEDHARHISQTARETTRALDEIVWAANPANDTLDGLVNYVCKYAQEFLALAGVRYRLDAPPALPELRLPPELRHNVFLAAKEAINNVVKHAQATEARVRLELTGSRFTFEIADNGVGPAGQATATERGRNGLRNMRKRMEDIGGTFSFEPGADGGSIVRLTAPLRASRTRSP